MTGLSIRQTRRMIHDWQSTLVELVRDVLCHLCRFWCSGRKRVRLEFISKNKRFKKKYLPIADVFADL